MVNDKLAELFSIIPEKSIEIHFCWGEQSTNDTMAVLIQKYPDLCIAVTRAADRHKLAYRFGLGPESFKFIKKDIVPQGDSSLVLFNFEEVNFLAALKTINQTNWKKLIIIYNIYEDITDE